jgi:hypothetical protein
MRRFLHTSFVAPWNCGIESADEWDGRVYNAQGRLLARYGMLDRDEGLVSVLGLNWLSSKSGSTPVKMNAAFRWRP